MRQKIQIVAFVLGMATGFMTEALALDNPVASARVRVFQQGDITLYPGEYCYGPDSSASIQASSSGFSLFSFSKRAGMPETDDIPGSYNEYEVPAGKALSVMLQWDGTRDGSKVICGPVGSTFFPQVGKNYDISLGYAGSCFVQIRELHETSPGKASARVTPSGFSYACVKQ